MTTLGQRSIDVLIVTAVKDEYDAVLLVHDGEAEAEAWTETSGAVTVAEKNFIGLEGKPLRFGVVQAFDMGQAAATHIAMKALSLNPRVLAMCGVCAGRRGKVELGDVIFADRVWTYDTGKVVRELDEDGVERERIDGDVKTWSLRSAWKQAAQRFSVPASANWLAERPTPLEQQGLWILHELANGGRPQGHAARTVRAPNWIETIEYLRKKKLVTAVGFEITDNGRALAAEDTLQHPDGNGLTPFGIHVAPMASGSAVREDISIFDRLAKILRKVSALEMEASAIGSLAELENLDHFVVAKAVMDFGDTDKADHFKKFAARASAECLIAFLRTRLIGQTQSSKATTARVSVGTPIMEATNAHLVWINDQEGLSTLLIASQPERIVQLPNLLLASTDSLWELDACCRPIRLFPNSALVDVFNGTVDWDGLSATERVLLSDAALVDRLSTVRIPLAGVTPESMSAERLFMHNRDIRIQGSIGPYLLVKQSDHQYGGGAHPDTTCSFSVIDFERIEVISDWLTPAEQRLILSAEGSLARRAFEVMREDEVFALDEGAEVQLVAASPIVDRAGSITLRYQFAAPAAYITSDGHWSSYTISEFVNSRTMPTRFAEFQTIPLPVAKALRGVPLDAIDWGFSSITQNHPGWVRLIDLQRTVDGQFNFPTH